ncbi:MAG: site-specific integrase [Clostridium sp.]|uniref:tyrosine-type recombinase/integrase n=1 Tax=Clostridium sp. TaxID=1506 RepID=UPI0025C43F4D|nr:tyrosine-type recombinase/integrase [Clostridium sp.]MCF0149105.1 site-specific integrase [Clostridium sp.]
MNGSVRKKGKSWYYRYYEYKDGKRKQIERVGGKTKSEALKKLNEEINRSYNGISRPEEIYLSDYLYDWLEDYIKDEKSDNTYYKYKCSVETKISKSIGNIKLCDLKPIHIEKYIKFLKGLNLNKTSIQFNYGVLNTALNKALKLQLIINNPCKYVDTPKREKYKANILTLDEYRLIYNSLDESIYEDYIMKLALDTALELGLRRGEMCGICIESIDFNLNKVIINKALIRIENKYVISGLKTEGSYRELPISEGLAEKYKKHIKLQQKNKLRYGQFYNKNIFNNQEYNLIFTWENGRAITPSSFLQRIKRLCKLHGIEKNIRWHDLRHTNATLLLEGGVDMKTLQERLGHSLMQTTSDTYSHVTEKMNRKATDVISNLMQIK